jgi:thioredoxin-dependent peroxiredoxin
MDPQHTATLAVGDLAPDFQLPSSTGHEIDLHDYRGRAHVVLFFVRAYQ